MTEFPTIEQDPTSKAELEATKRALEILRKMQTRMLEDTEAQIIDVNGQIREIQSAERKAQYVTIRTLSFEEQLVNFTEEDLFSPFEMEVKANWEQLLQLALKENRIPDLLNWIREVLKIKPVFTMFMPASIIMKSIDQLFDLSTFDQAKLATSTDEFWSYTADGIASGEFPKK